MLILHRQKCSVRLQISHLFRRSPGNTLDFTHAHFDQAYVVGLLAAAGLDA